MVRGGGGGAGGGEGGAGGGGGGGGGGVRGFKEVGKCAAPCFEIVRITISVGSS